MSGFPRGQRAPGTRSAHPIPAPLVIPPQAQGPWQGPQSSARVFTNSCIEINSHAMNSPRSAVFRWPQLCQHSHCPTILLIPGHCHQPQGNLVLTAIPRRRSPSPWQPPVHCPSRVCAFGAAHVGGARPLCWTSFAEQNVFEVPVSLLHPCRGEEASLAGQSTGCSSAHQLLGLWVVSTHGS